ncbi:hypothetical protein BMMON2_08840 [Burkholderia mallei]
METTMDKRLSALCGLGLASAGACAQTSVTLYGVADAYVEYATNQADAKGEPAALARMGSGGKSGSRWESRAPKCSAAAGAPRSGSRAAST